MGVRAHLLPGAIPDPNRSPSGASPPVEMPRRLDPKDEGPWPWPRPRGSAMSDKSPRQTPSKKTKSLKEKRAIKKAKKT